MPYSVVISSNDLRQLERCRDAIAAHQPNARLVIVTNSLDYPGAIRLDTPFQFSRNMNAGIVAAGRNDVILCNHDALLRTRSGFDALARAAEYYGVVSPVIDGRCGNAGQKIMGQGTVADPNQGTVAKPNQGTVAEPNPLAFVCPYIPRATIDAIGLLDERFEVGTWEDTDYCRRVQLAGMTLGICRDCIVTHAEEDAILVKQPDYDDIFDRNQGRFDAKYATERLMLSLCICSIRSREQFLSRLMECLRPQLAEFGQWVEVLTAVDNGNASIGEKRQRLLEASRGEYVASIDDDDLVSPDYLRQIILTILRGTDPDCVTFRGRRYRDGMHTGDVLYSLKNERDSDGLENGRMIYRRSPYHVNPIRRELAMRVGFKGMDFREDGDFSQRLRPLLKSEEFIDAPLYYYYWRTEANRQSEATHEDVLSRQIDPRCMTPRQIRAAIQAAMY